ncbi:DUF2703 domain-containing protein [Methylacidiphilum caldifontis]|uniref:DUF2703 domain-containing protein n=1 Tax=Methylacidiphilum caldifontis TaxID=2795386 RepID=UPI001A907278|nr:DUF2703 domain-containing protein [Methylacidiphilum caldifontis]QSR88267.1 DUF2703 domain-containing protein [Methylacidiphilum caldifontis]
MNCNDNTAVFCDCKTTQTQEFCGNADDNIASNKKLSIELLAIDLSRCNRCIPTAKKLKKAIEILRPVAQILGIELEYKETVVFSLEDAKEKALLSSPTIRINGHDTVQNVQESLCESCSSLTQNNIPIDCRD